MYRDIHDNYSNGQLGSFMHRSISTEYKHVHRKKRGREERQGRSNTGKRDALRGACL